jgi:ferredoxin
VHTEAFTLPQFVAEANTIGGELRFSSAGQDVANDGRPILEQAESAGLVPEFGCRMGICHTCVRPLRCGTVRDLVTGELVTGDGQDIRICVSAPVGDADVDL